MSGARRGVTLLALGAAAGIGAATAGLLAPEDAGPPAGAVALVNGEPIAAADYDRALAALAGDRRGGLDAAERRRVLDRLVDEELLLQRGVALGLVRRDSTVRKNLVSAVVGAVVDKASEAAPTDDAVAAFYDEHRDFFARPGRVHVRQVWCKAATPVDAPAALERARQATTRLRAGEELAAVRAALGDPELPPLPDAPVPPAKLVDYLGPTVLRATLDLKPGGVSDPVRSASGYHVLAMVAREGQVVPPLDDIREEVRAEVRRRAGEAALRAYVDDLRRQAAIELRPPEP